jgi:GDPmannose 4,6-dehydratase
MIKISLITGITGQDGAYLARLLLAKGHKVIGVIRHGQNVPIFGLEYLGITQQVKLVPCDLCSAAEVRSLLETERPDEIYNLASQSSVRLSFLCPGQTLAFNTLSVLTLLETIRQISPNIRFYQASSSEMFGRIPELPIKEDMAFHPLSPYAVSKASAHWMTKNYRESYGLFISCGILFNHESYLRTRDFFVKKIICEALEVAAGKRPHIAIGNLAAKRDFGYAPAYVEAMYLMMQHGAADDFIICSGRSLSLREIAEHVCDKVGIDHDLLTEEPGLFRPLDIVDIFGDNVKAKEVLGWSYNMSFFDVLNCLIAEEKKNFR